MTLNHVGCQIEAAFGNKMNDICAYAYAGIRIKYLINPAGELALFEDSKKE